MTVARKDYHSITNAIDWIAQIGVSAANSIPIFSQMPVWPKAARLVVALGVRYPNGKIKAGR